MTLSGRCWILLARVVFHRVLSGWFNVAARAGFTDEAEVEMSKLFFLCLHLSGKFRQGSRAGRAWYVFLCSQWIEKWCDKI